MIEVPSLKVTVPIQGHLLPRDILPPLGQPGAAKALVTIKLKCDGVNLSVQLKAKSYRDVLAKVDASPHGAYAVLQGKLKRGEIVEAGFTVQPIVPKESVPGTTPQTPPVATQTPTAPTVTSTARKYARGRQVLVPTRSLHL